MMKVLVCALVLVSLPSFSGGVPASARLVMTAGCEGVASDSAVVSTTLEHLAVPAPSAARKATPPCTEPRAPRGEGSEEGGGEGMMVEGEIYAGLGEQGKVNYQGTKNNYIITTELAS